MSSSVPRTYKYACANITYNYLQHQVLLFPGNRTSGLVNHPQQTTDQTAPFAARINIYIYVGYSLSSSEND